MLHSYDKYTYFAVTANIEYCEIRSNGREYIIGQSLLPSGDSFQYPLEGWKARMRGGFIPRIFYSMHLGALHCVEFH